LRSMGRAFHGQVEIILEDFLRWGWPPLDICHGKCTYRGNQYFSLAFTPSHIDNRTCSRTCESLRYGNSAPLYCNKRGNTNSALGIGRLGSSCRQSTFTASDLHPNAVRSETDTRSESELDILFESWRPVAKPLSDDSSHHRSPDEDLTETQIIKLKLRNESSLQCKRESGGQQ
jgi:hypothetical protein